MEISRVEATKMQDSIGTMAADINLVGVNTAEVSKTMFELRETMGGLRLDPALNAQHKELIETTTILNEKYGTTTEEAMALKGIATNMNISQEELAATMATYGDNTIGAKKAMQALAKVPKTIASNFKGTTKELANAVVKAEMLGMTLEDVNNIGDSMLDIESSLQAEMEARVMTGRNLNLDKIRELSLAGDIAGMQDEIVRQAGTLEEFNELDKLGKESLAKAMGMNVEQMTNMLTKQEELKELGWDNKKMAEMEAKSAEEINAMLNEKGKIDNENARAKLQQLAAEKESAGLQDRFSDALTKIKETMFKLVTPIMEIVNGMFEAGDQAESTNGILSGIGDTLSVIGTILGVVFKMFKFIFDIAWELLTIALTPTISVISTINEYLTPIIKYITDIIDGVMEWTSALDIVTDVMSSIETAIDNALMIPINFVLDAIGVLVKLFTGDIQGALSDVGSLIFDHLTRPFQMVGGLIDDIFGTNIMGMIDAIKSNFTGFVDDAISAVMNLLSPFKAIGKLILDLILTPVDYITGMFNGLVQIFTGDFVGGLETIGNTIKNTLMAPFDYIWGVIQLLIDGFDEMLGLVGSVGDAASAVGSFFGMGDDDEDEPSGGGAVPAMATGGKVNKGGIALVGEEGPELVKMPGAAEVTPNSEIYNESDSGGASNEKVIEILSAIYAEVQKPALIKLGDKFVGELDSTMGIRRNLRAGFDNQYGSTT